MLVSKVNMATPNTAFKGILREVSSEHIDETFYEHGMEKYMGTDSSTTIKAYYPWLDESKAKIEETVKKESKYEEYMDDCIQYVNKTKVILKETLPVTEAEGKAFMKEYNLGDSEFIKFFELHKLFTKNNIVRKLRVKI